MLTSQGRGRGLGPGPQMPTARGALAESVGEAEGSRSAGVSCLRETPGGFNTRTAGAPAWSRHLLAELGAPHVTSAAYTAGGWEHQLGVPSKKQVSLKGVK